jgi:tetratricopeptide (TPR) repeat protein
MHGRAALVLFFAILLGNSGCRFLKDQQTGPAAPKPSEPAPHLVQKAKDGPKRKPKAETVIALAVMKETDADKVEDAAGQMKVRDEARMYFREAIKIDPKCREAYQGLARVLAKMGDYDKAFETYQQALAANPKDAFLWYDLGQCHNKRKQFDQAIDCFKKSLEIDPENRQFMQVMGFTLARANRPDESLPYLKLSMGEAQAHLNLARMMQHLKQEENCRRHLTLALQLDPNMTLARDMLTQMTRGGAPLQQTGGVEEAEQ